MENLTLSFEVRGGGYDPMANPMPKLKLTGRQAWLQRVQNYVEWKEHVQLAFVDALKAYDAELGKVAEQRVAGGEKPLDTGKHPMYMHIHIYWRGDAHGDPENVFGSIADAMFHNDKYLALKVDYTPQPKTAEPYVTITIQPYATNTSK